MTDAELGSRSDLEALARSGRGKVIALVLMLAAALAAASWFFFVRKQGTGNAEDPAKVLIVARTRGFSLVLGDVGFEAHEGTFEAWEQKARDEVPNLEVDGIESIMQLADRFGYGYVVFEGPQDVDFSALDIDEVPEMPEHVRFAVLSAGDFGFPHVMTVNPEPSEVLSGPSIVLLQALFEQEKLHELLPGDDASTSMDAIQLKDKLRDALEQLAQIPEAEKMAAKIVQEVRRALDEDERGETKPMQVGEPLDSGSAIPLANGELLSTTRALKVVTRDALKANIQAADEDRLWVGKPGVEAQARAACEVLGGGAISENESPRYWPSADGSALVLQTLGDGLTLWTVDGAKPGCAFTKVGSVPAASPGLGNPVPAAHGQVARAGMVGTQGVVSVVAAGKDDETMLGMLDGIEPESVAWLSDRHLVAVGRGEYGEGADLYFFDVQAPMTVLRLSGTIFENAETMHEVAVGKQGPKPVIVVSAGSMPRKAYRLELPSDLGTLFASPPEAAPEPEPEPEPDTEPDVDGKHEDKWIEDEDEDDYGDYDPYGDEAEPVEEVLPSREERGLPKIVVLDANRFVGAALTHEGSVNDLHVSADGAWVTFELTGDVFDPSEPHDSEIAVVPTKGGSLQVLTRNALPDRDPRLTPSGSHVVFETRVDVAKTEAAFLTPRIVPVGP